MSNLSFLKREGGQPSIQCISSLGSADHSPAEKLSRNLTLSRVLSEQVMPAASRPTDIRIGFKRYRRSSTLHVTCSSAPDQSRNS